MFYKVKDYPFLDIFIKNVDVISEEFFLSLKNPKINELINPQHPDEVDYYSNFWVSDNGFHIDQTGVDIRVGKYNPLAIFKRDYPIKHFDNEKIYPRINELLSTVPNLHFSAFVKMDAHSVLRTHTHTRKHLIFHLLLNDLESGESITTVGKEKKKMKHRGDSLLFDYSMEHGSKNTSNTTRYNFLIDFNPFEVS